MARFFLRRSATTSTLRGPDTLRGVVLITSPLADNAATADALTRGTTVSRGLADGAAATDTITRSGVSSRTLNDLATVGDAFTRTVLLYRRSIADGAAASDVLVTQVITNVNWIIQPIIERWRIGPVTIEV